MAMMVKAVCARLASGLFEPRLAEIAHEPTNAREAAFASWMMVGSRAPPA
jgi:hypothetical protein